MWVAGADGFKDRWCVVLWQLETGELRTRVTDDFAGLLSLQEDPAVVAVDIPIGLPDVTRPGGRTCDRLARKLVGPRASSVFSPVGRTALAAPSRLEAEVLSHAEGGIGITAQAWGLSEKMREADAAMTPERQRQVFEVHPELSFWSMQSEPMTYAKTKPAGVAARVRALIESGLPAAFVSTRPAGLRATFVDFLDACAALQTAKRIALGQAKRLPEVAERDSRGLDMVIWY